MDRIYTHTYVQVRTLACNERWSMCVLNLSSLDQFKIGTFWIVYGIDQFKTRTFWNIEIDRLKTRTFWIVYVSNRFCMFWNVHILNRSKSIDSKHVRSGLSIQAIDSKHVRSGSSIQAIDSKHVRSGSSHL